MLGKVISIWPFQMDSPCICSVDLQIHLGISGWISGELMVIYGGLARDINNQPVAALSDLQIYMVLGAR